jgi:hypothetical protein
LPVDAEAWQRRSDFRFEEFAGVQRQDGQGRQALRVADPRQAGQNRETLPGVRPAMCVPFHVLPFHVLPFHVLTRRLFLTLQVQLLNPVGKNLSLR